MLNTGLILTRNTCKFKKNLAKEAKSSINISTKEASIMTKSSQTTINATRIQENIKLSKQLRAQQMNYNGFAALTTMAAIASYVGAAATLDQQEYALATGLLAIAIAEHLASFYCMYKSYQKGQAAMNALKHNIKVK